MMRSLWENMLVNIKRFFVTLVILMTFGWQTANAGELTIGAKTGVQAVDFDAAEGEDPNIAASILVGYIFMDLPGMDLAAEVQFDTSLTEGEVNNDEYSVETIGAFASIRTGGPIYFIGRLGYVDTEFDFTDGLDVDDDGAAFGVGIGFGSITNLEVELSNYSYSDLGSSLYLSLGINF